MKILVFVFVFLISCFSFFNSTEAASAGDIIINEIAWMGTANSANDEWIELYNNTDSPVNLEGWNLKNIKLAGIIPAKGFYLLERTDDSTLPQITADQIYTGALNNKGEELELYDNLGNLIDLVDASSGWPAGDNSIKQTMERTAFDWQTSQNPGGTPKNKNSELVIEALPQSNKEMAAVGEPAQILQEKFKAGKQTPIFIALAIAVFSGIMILILKRKLI